MIFHESKKTFKKSKPEKHSRLCLSSSACNTNTPIRIIFPNGSMLRIFFKSKKYETSYIQCRHWFMIHFEIATNSANRQIAIKFWFVIAVRKFRKKLTSKDPSRLGAGVISWCFPHNTNTRKWNSNRRRFMKKFIQLRSFFSSATKITKQIIFTICPSSSIPPTQIIIFRVSKWVHCTDTNRIWQFSCTFAVQNIRISNICLVQLHKLLIFSCCWKLRMLCLCMKLLRWNGTGEQVRRVNCA